jgi:hypothetical protein
MITVGSFEATTKTSSGSASVFGELAISAGEVEGALRMVDEYPQPSVPTSHWIGARAPCVRSW